MIKDTIIVITGGLLVAFAILYTSQYARFSVVQESMRVRMQTEADVTVAQYEVLGQCVAKVTELKKCDYLLKSFGWKMKPVKVKPKKKGKKK